ncbi:MAG: aminopeptidase P family protein [bacterium]|nr:aminopeptidase P family protein [bacterium]MCM1375578.1 aminopeptidase P family protein [Muribaculum sp.]
MENKVIQQRLAALRQRLRQEGIDYYLIPTADFHNSEYVNAYFAVREYFCGFTGSNGTLVVWQEGAALWTDGRYFIQAERELAGTTVELMRMQQEGVPTIEEFLTQRMEQGQTLGFDGRVLSAGDGLRYEKALKDKEIHFTYDQDIAGSLWEGRPSLPAGPVTVLPPEVAGSTTQEKLAYVHSAMKKEKADGFLLSKLDDLMWLFNIRGCDVECNPVALSYAYITEKETHLFIQEQALDQRVRDDLAQKQAQLHPYASVVDFLRALPEGGSVLVDRRQVSYALYKAVSARQRTVEVANPTELLKAIKNPVELANMEKIYLKDSVALTKFIYWVKTNIGKIEITEISAADYLEQLRRAIPEFLDLSFPTISAYGPNAAMMHYGPTPESHAVCKPEGMLLVDSGGQYLGGTTDVTRTIVLGPITEEQKMHYTLVAGAMLQMSAARWLYGCTGRNLDILARQRLWNAGLDYRCGTGHGVGYILNVHEGPQSLRWQYVKGLEETPFEEGMDVTNEPGVYVQDSHGIRIENVMVAKNDVKNEYGQFMHFETLTWVPIDRDGIDERYLTEEQRVLLRAYQREVYDRISPYLTREEAAWLWEETEAASTSILKK